MSGETAFRLRKNVVHRHTRTLSNGNKPVASYETTAPPTRKKPQNKQPSKKIMLRMNHDANPQTEEAVPCRKPSFRLRQLKPSQHGSQSTASSLMKPPVCKDSKTGQRQSSTNSRNAEQMAGPVLYTEIVQPKRSETSTAKSARKSPQHLNYFERPKIPHIMKQKFMKAEGCEEDVRWNDYWIGIEKKISVIEPKDEESMLLGQSCVELFLLGN